jgi:glycosyltransferase involved in cell wall biosynthesis
VKILVVHNFYQQGGGEDSVVRAEVAMLKEHGHNVDLHSVHNDAIKGLAKRIETFLNVTYNHSARDALKKRIQEFQPAVVHVHNFFPLLSPSIFDACIESGIPSVMTLHNYRILCPTSFLYHDEKVRERSLHHPCWWTVWRRVYHNSFIGTWAVANMVESHKQWGTWQRKVDRFIALTEFAKNKFIEGGLPADRIVVKGNAALKPPLTPGEWNGSRQGALYVGRMSEEKGIISLIKAWMDLDYPLCLVGDGPMSDWVRRNAGSNIRCAGRLSRDQVCGEMLKASFLVFPSLWYEMFPVVIAEAFACGLPVIASTLPSIDELVEANTTGLRFPVGNVAGLREKVRWAISHPEEMQRMGANARTKHEQYYTPAVNYDRLINIYRSLQVM